MKGGYIEEYIPVDLHVHTPASNCYKRNCENIEEEYISLIKMYVEKGVKVIAITDHNTVKGYKEIKRIEGEIVNRVKYWRELGDIELLHEKLEEEENKAELFSRILILPGVEFEAFPGIHILLIFNPEGENIIKQIEKFLSDNGYPDDAQGKERVDVTSVSAVEIIEEAASLGGLTIAAHIDSDKGAMEKLKDSGRVRFFKSNSLHGVQVVKPETIDYLKTLLQNKEYKRDRELAYMRFSDYHNKEEIDGKISYFKITNICFDEVKSIVLEHPELISFTPKIKEMDLIERVVSLPETKCFENFRGDNRENILKCICALLNSGRGNIVVGIGRKKSICGMKLPVQEAKQIIEAIMQEYNDYLAYFKHTKEYFELGELTVVIIRLWSIGNIIFEHSDSVYVLSEKGTVVKATVSDIFELGEQNYQRSFERINDMNQARIKLIHEQLDIVNNIEENIELNRKILKYSVAAENIFDMEKIVYGNDFELEMDGLGSAEGNVYHVPTSDAHYAECYSRILCPLYRISEEEFQSNNEIKRSGECGIVTSSFAAHYIAGEAEYYIDGNFAITFSLKPFLQDQYSIPAIILWLKSPILLYYLQTINGTYRLAKPGYFMSAPILLHNNMRKGGQIDKIAEDIMIKEKEFLKMIETMNDEEINDFIEEHNTGILSYVYQVEELFKKMLNICDEEYHLILDFADSEGWKYFNISNFECVEIAEED